MDIRRVYLMFTDRVNSLTTNHGAHIGGLRQFVDCFNEAQMTMLNQALINDEQTDVIQEFLSYLLKDPYRTSGIEQGRFYSYQLPDKWEHIKSCYVTAHKNACTQELLVRMVRSGDETRLYMDEFSKPSFEWQETFGIISENKLRVYVTDFGLGQITLNYLVRPPAVSIEGFTDELGNLSTNIDPIWEGRNLNSLVNLAAAIHLRNVGNANQMQLFK